MFEPNFTKKDFEDMKNESKEGTYEEKAYRKGVTFKKTHYYSKYSRDIHFLNLKKAILGKFKKIKNKIIENLIDFVNNICKSYLEELYKNSKEQEQKLSELLKEKIEIEEQNRKIEKLNCIIKEISLFKNELKNLEKEMNII